MSPCPLCLCRGPTLLAQIKARRYGRCPECLLVFLAPEQRPDSQVELQRYLRHENSPEGPKYREFLGRLTSHLLPHLTPGASGLDYGAGPGPTLSVMLEEQGFSVETYDPYFAPEPAVLERTYDFITCTETVEHFHHPAREFRRLNGMLKVGGWLAGCDDRNAEVRRPF